MKTSYVDYQALAAQFKVGERVRKVDPVRGREFPNFLEGRVEAVLSSIGFVDVAFPWGTDRMSPDLLMKVEGTPAVYSDFLDSYDRRKSASAPPLYKVVAALFARHAGTLYETALRMREVGIEEMDAYSKMATRYASTYGDDVVREAVQFAYDVNEKVAIYWKARGRQYVPTKQERETGVLFCPRCKCEMGRTVYKKRTKLYACGECLFLIKPGDLVDCDAEPVECEEEEEGLEFTSPNSVLNEWL